MTSAIAAIHSACKQLGIDEDGRRAIYVRVTGKDRLTLMSPAEKQTIVEEMRRLGFTKKPTAPARPSFRPDGRAGRPALSGKYLPKLQALWIACHNLGVIDDPRDSAMEAFVLGRQLPHLSDIRFVHQPGDAASAIEALKAMLTRAGVARETQYPGQKDGEKIACAQWAILRPEDGEGFWPMVTGILNQPAGYRNVMASEWITVMNFFGPQVRALRKAGAK